MGDKIFRTTISIPLDLKERMNSAIPSVNWSAVAAAAFREKLDEIDGSAKVSASRGCFRGDEVVDNHREDRQTSGSAGTGQARRGDASPGEFWSFFQSGRAFMAMLDLHHIDFDQLEKGSVIDAVVVQAVIGVQRSDRAFSLGLLRLKGVIEDFFYSERGQRVVVRSHRDSLIVLDDPEQSRHSRHTFNAELCRLEEIHQDLLAVDTRNLNSEEHEAHTRAEVVQSKYLQAIGNVRAKLLPRPTERTVPGMVS